MSEYENPFKKKSRFARVFEVIERLAGRRPEGDIARGWRTVEPLPEEMDARRREAEGRTKPPEAD